MKTQKIKFTAILFALAFALQPIAQAWPRPDGGPTVTPANELPRPDGGPTVAPANELSQPDGENLPVITIKSTGDVTRGKIGSFVLDMNPTVMFGGTYVNFSVSGTAIPGVDYVAVVSPAYIGQSGCATILVQTLPDPRASFRQPYSVVVTLEPGAGYALGEPSSATMWIKP